MLSAASRLSRKISLLIKLFQISVSFSFGSTIMLLYRRSAIFEPNKNLTRLKISHSSEHNKKSHNIRTIHCTRYMAKPSVQPARRAAYPTLTSSWHLRQAYAPSGKYELIEMSRKCEPAAHSARNLQRLGRNSPTVLSRLWTKLHQIWRREYLID